MPMAAVALGRKSRPSIRIQLGRAAAVALASPCSSMSLAMLYRQWRPQDSHSIETVGTRKSERV